MWRIWISVLLISGVSTVLILGVVPGAVAQEPDSFAVIAQIERTLVEAIAKAEQSVVSIARIKRTAIQVAQDELPLGLPGFNRRPGQEVDPDDPSNPEFIPTDFGSGVVIGIDPPNTTPRRTYILTNYHVVKGGTRTIPIESLPDDYQLHVRIPSRRGFEAKIYAADPRSDLAVITILDADVKPIKLGDGSKLKKGQLVIALGNPYAAARDGSASASWGMVSNLRRRPGAARDTSDFDRRKRDTLHDLGDLIQVDTRLNLGTSGGALINLKGELVGLTTALAALAGFEKSSGFAVPIDSASMRVIQSLREGKEVEYGFLGVSFGPPNADIRKSFPTAVPSDSPSPEGAFVTGIIYGGPAHRAGLRQADTILNVNGERVYTRDDLTREINKLGPDGKARLTVWRRGDSTSSSITLDVALTKWGAYDEEGIVATNLRYPPWRALMIDYSTARDKHNGSLQQLVFPPEGVLILKVLPPLDGMQSDIVEGNRIRKVNQRSVTTPAEFYDAVKDLRGDVILEIDDGFEKDKDGRDLKDREGREIVKVKKVTIHE